MIRAILFALMTITISSAAQAREWILGAGFADFSREISEDSALVSVAYHHDPFHQGTRLDMGWGGAAALDSTGDFFLGLGLVGAYDLGQNWFIEASVMPGSYFENATINDLGSRFEIRSLIALGYEFKTGNALSLALTHKSNASTASINPGVNALQLRWHVRY